MRESQSDMVALAEIDLAHARVGGDLRRRALDQYCALDQHGDAPREAEDEIHVVLDDQHGDVARELRDDVEDDGAFGRRHARRRLVQQQHFRPEAEGDRDLDQALAAVRQLLQRPLRFVCDPQPLEQGVGFLDDAAMRAGDAEHGAGHALALADRQRHVLEHGQPLEELVDLEGAAQPALDARLLRQRGDVLAGQPDLARRRRQASGDQVDERGLAGAVGTDQRVPRACLEAEVDVLRHAQRAEILVQPGGFECRGHERRRTMRQACSARPITPPRANMTTSTSSRPEPEEPVDRIGLGKLVLGDHENRRADEGAVEPADAAEDEHDEDGAGALEADDVEADELRRLREQAAGDAGEHGGDRVRGDEAPAHRRADRMHAHHVLANPGQRAPERRMHQHAHEQPAQEQDRQAVPVGGAAEHVEAEGAEDRLDAHALQAVGAAGQPARLVGQLLQHEDDGKREHQQGQAVRAQDDHAGDQPDDARDDAGDRQCAEWLVPAVHGQDAGGVGADAEERGMAERHDAGVAEDEVQRQREQDHDEDLAAQRQVVGKQEIAGDRDQPRRRFPPAQAVAAQHGVDGRERLELREHASGPPEQPLRAPQQQGERRHIDEKGAELRDQVLAGEVADAEQQCREEGPADRAEPADGDDDQEVDEVLEGISGIDRQDLGAESAAQRRKRAAEREGQGEEQAGVDAERLRHAAVVDGGADARAEIGALEGEPQRAEDDEAGDQDEGAIGRERHAAEAEFLPEDVRHAHALRQRPPDEFRRGGRHEDQADREQHLFQLAGIVEPRIEHPLQYDAGERHDDAGDDQRRRERHAVAVHHRHGDIAAGHGEHAMREVGEAHQAHRHRQADRDDVENHRIRCSVEQDADDR